jgi:hypothetical protein
MKVKCNYNKAAKAFEGYKMPLGTSIESGYGVDVGVVYIVAGMAICNGQLFYYLYNGSYPELCPFQLFEVVDSEIPKGWHFRKYTLNDPQYPYIESVWGYYEFCFDESHYTKIIDYDAKALELFHKRLREFS